MSNKYEVIKQSIWWQTATTVVVVVGSKDNDASRANVSVQWWH